MKCERCANCGQEVESFYYCSYVTDGGQTYESCFCLCERCRDELTQLGRVTLWRPPQEADQD